MEKSRYIDPFTDYGFKRVFGTETNKDLLIAFLNALFRGRKHINDLKYNKTEYVGETEEIGSVLFDLTCTAANGEQFILEMQRTSNVNLKRRMLYYGSKIIVDQAPKGERKKWNYAISEVYLVVLMDGFVMPGVNESEKYMHDICLRDRDTGKIFYEDLGFIFLELINFNKSEGELVGDIDMWMYVLKNLSKANKLPVFLRKTIFEKVFEIAEYSKLNKEEREMYDISLKRKWDAESYRESAIIEKQRAREEGLEEGRHEGRREGREEERAKADAERLAEKRTSALKMLQSGLATELIADIIGLSVREIEELKG